MRRPLRPALFSLSRFEGDGLLLRNLKDIFDEEEESLPLPFRDSRNPDDNGVEGFVGLGVSFVFLLHRGNREAKEFLDADELD